MTIIYKIEACSRLDKCKFKPLQLLLYHKFCVALVLETSSDIEALTAP